MTAAIERFPGKFPIVGDVMNRTEEIRDGQLERTRYSTIHTRRGKFTTLMYLKTVGEQLDPAAFIRVHKSYIVSAGKIEGIDGNEIYIGAQKIPLSRNYRDQVMEQVVSRKLWVR